VGGIEWVPKQPGSKADDDNSRCRSESRPNPDVSGRQKAVNTAGSENAADDDKDLPLFEIHWNRHLGIGVGLVG
jgi:hypothetical protein